RAPGIALRDGARRDGGDEAVAPVFAGDEPRSSRIVTKDCAEVADVALDRSPIDDVRWPNRPQDFFRAYSPGAVLEEHGQHPRRCPAEGEVETLPGQATGADVEGEGPEVDHPFAILPRRPNILPDSTVWALMFHRPRSYVCPCDEHASPDPTP